MSVRCHFDRWVCASVAPSHNPPPLLYPLAVLVPSHLCTGTTPLLYSCPWLLLVPPPPPCCTYAAPASHILDRWFDSEILKTTLATDAVIGALCSPTQAGSAYVLLHHVMGEAAGQKVRVGEMMVC